MASLDQDKKALGGRLRAARKLRGLTLEAVAAHLTEMGKPTTKAAVGHWETGTNVPDSLILRRLAKLYRTTADALLWDDSISMEAIQIAAEYDALDEANRRRFKSLWMAWFATATEDGAVEKAFGVPKTVLAKKVSPIDNED